MNKQQAINLLKNLEQSLDDYCELNEEGKTAFRMAIEALNCSEFPNNSDTISRQAAIDAICEDGTQLERQGQYSMTMAERKQRDADILDALPSAQPNLKGAKFEIICSQRQTGRTTKLIEKCARYRYALIVCPSRMRASNIFHYARKMGIHIPMPMTFGDFLRGRFAAEHINAFLIDDLDQCLAIYAQNVPIDTVVFERRAEE